MKNADRIEAGLTDVTQGRTHWILAAAGAVGAAGVIWTMQVLTIRSDLDQVISDIFFRMQAWPWPSNGPPRYLSR